MPPSITNTVNIDPHLAPPRFFFFFFSVWDCDMPQAVPWLFILSPSPPALFTMASQ